MSKIVICAEGIIRDAQTNTISVFNMLEDVSAPGFPLFIQKFNAFFLLERTNDEPQQINCIFRIENNGNSLMEMPVRSDFQNKLKNRLIININGLAIPNPGILRATLFHNERVLGNYEVAVNRIGNPQAHLT